MSAQPNDAPGYVTDEAQLLSEILQELKILNATLKPFAEKFGRKLPVGAWLKG